MHRRIFLQALAAVSLAPAPLWASAQNDLNEVAAYRGLDGAFSFDLEIAASGRGGQRAKVLFRSFESVLVDFNAPASHVGRRILFAGSQMWMALPGSARPLRITPADRLLGEASIGDILNIDPAAYTAREGPAETVDGQALRTIIAEGRGRPLYPRVDFLVGKSNRPVISRHYAQSGKVLKTAVYTGFGREAGRERLREMRLTEAASRGSTTTLRFDNYRAGQFPAAWFNQAALHTPLNY
jgi:hypothetical protein